MSDSTPRARVAISRNTLGEINPHIFGGMIEHFGRTVYGGVWDVDRDIARPDVKAAIQAMGVTALRYPGGGFSATYHWKDGIGPKADRPVRESSFWSEMGENWHRLQSKGDPRYVEDPKELGKIIGPPELNLMGTDEFLQYALDVDAEPNLVVNISDGTVEEAVEWVRYCNVDRKSPRPVKYWAIANEAWNRFQLPNWSPEEYGRIVVEYASAMKAVDPSIVIIATGQPVSPDADEPQGNAKGGQHDTQGGMPHVQFASREWNKGFLEVAGDHVDMLDVHWYFPGMSGQPLDGDRNRLQIVTSPDLLNDALATTAVFADEVVPGKKLPIQVGEWMRMVQFEDHLEVSHPLGDAAFFAGVYNAFVNNADRVKLAIVSHLVTTLAPIQANAGRLYVTSAYLVAQLYAKHAVGQSLEVSVESPSLDVEALELEGGFVAPAARKPRTAQQLTATAASDGEHTSVFLVNRSQTDSITVEVSGLSGESALTRWVDGPSLEAANTADDPDVLGFSEQQVAVTGGTANVTVPPSTVTAVIV